MKVSFSNIIGAFFSILLLSCATTWDSASDKSSVTIGGAAVQKKATVDSSAANIPPEMRSEIRVKSGTVSHLDGSPKFWSTGARVAVAPGEHVIEMAYRQSEGLQETVFPFSCHLESGTVYLLVLENSDSRTSRTDSYIYGGEGVMGTRRRTLTSIQSSYKLNEYGITEAVIPNRNQSVVEFDLGSDGQYMSTFISVNNKTYTLSRRGVIGEDKIRLLLPEGDISFSCGMRNNAFTQTLNISAFRHISYSVDAGNKRLITNFNDSFE